MKINLQKVIYIRNYGLKNVGYIWVREREKSKQQHYHLAIMLDENKIRHPKRLNAQIKEMWLPYGHMPTIKKPYFNINTIKANYKAVREDIILRVSYLAKVRGKRYRDVQTKDYQTSRLRNQR
jgi:hypothetical protein